MTAAFFESFDNGIGALNHTWGSRDIDTSVRGQVTLTGDSGIMEFPGGISVGHGYGSYSIVAKLTGHEPGPAGLLWPGNDVWPGPEMDLVEFIGGRPYGTMHFRGSDGGDVFGSIYYNGVDERQVHTYTMDWEPGVVTFSVDGRVFGGYSDNVSRDYDHGGMNVVFSVMNRNPNTSITVYEVSYSPSGGGGGGGGGSAVQAEVTGQGVSAAVEAPAVAAAATLDVNQYEGLPGWMWPAEARWWDFV